MKTIKTKTAIFLQKSNNDVISLPGARAQSQKSCPLLTTKELKSANNSVSNCNVKSTDCQNYNAYSAEERAQIGKYTAEIASPGPQRLWARTQLSTSNESISLGSTCARWELSVHASLYSRQLTTPHTHRSALSPKYISPR